MSPWREMNGFRFSFSPAQDANSKKRFEWFLKTSRLVRDNCSIMLKCEWHSDHKSKFHHDRPRPVQWSWKHHQCWWSRLAHEHKFKYSLKVAFLAAGIFYVLFAGWEGRIEKKNCDRGLENADRGRGPRAAFPRPRSLCFTILTNPKYNTATGGSCRQIAHIFFLTLSNQF